MSTDSIRRGALVAAPQPEAAFEGARVLGEGGNAADALVAAAFVQGVVDPHRCGVGGFGCATLHMRDGTSLAVDFHGRAGSRAVPTLWQDAFESETPDGFGYLVRGKVNDVGYASITVPGMVAGVAAIHARFGRLPWRDLVERAVPYAESGFRVSRELAEFWSRPGLHGRVSTADRLGRTPAGRRICFKANGETYKATEIFRQPELAEAYRRLARDGAEAFYRGALGREMSGDWEANGALVTAGDLSGYRPQIHAPLRGRFRGLQVLTSPLPGGGVALLQVLKLAARTDVSRHHHNSPRYIHQLGRILQAVWADRLSNQGDPAFGTPPAEHFLEDSYLERLLAAGSTSTPVAAESTDTTQLSLVDDEGNAISFSHSLGYNSGVFAPRLGILFNNCMSAFDPRPGRSNSLCPGKARSTAVAETILLRDGKPCLVLGSPGAARITAGLAQVILNVVDFGMSVAEAVVQPRFDAYGVDTLLLESRFTPPQVRELERLGWKIVHSPNPFGVVGRVYAVQREPDGRLVAGVDPGSSGAACGPVRAERRPTGDDRW